MNQTDHTLPLAWAGWRMRIPEHWRLLRVDGSWQRGYMTVGDSQTAQFQVKWWRPRRGFDAQRWIERKVRRMSAEPNPADPKEPRHPEGFDEAAWVPRAKGPKGTFRPVWYGYAKAAGLLLEVVLNPRAPASDRRLFRRQLLATLEASEAGAETQWAVFDAVFGVAGGFVPVEHKLHLGNLMLRFRDGVGRQLFLRQVYPANLALQRRELGFWLRQWSFKEFRRHHALGRAEACSIPVHEEPLHGLRLRGRKFYRWPFNRIRPRESLSIALHDRRRDRLLLVEYDTPAPLDDSVPHAILAGMNRP